MTIYRGKMIDNARAVLRAAGPDGHDIVESTPAKGGLRRRGVELLIDNGEAEWIIEGVRARLIEVQDENRSA